MLFLIIFAVAVCFVIAISITISVVKRKKSNYVLLNSPFLRALSEINEKYVFDDNFKRNIKIHYSLNSKPKFDRFSSEDALRQAFFDNQLRIKTLVEKVARQKILYKKYFEELSKIQITDFDSLPKTRLLKKAEYYDIEKKLVSQRMKKPDLSISLDVRWSYTSPAGRNYYEDYKTLDYDGIVKVYANYYGVNLSKVEENDFLEQGIRNVINSMTSSGYSVPQIINLFKTYGINADEKLARMTAVKAGFYKNRNSEIYIKETVGTVSDMILCSAESNGLLHYENTVKDEEYDKAIVSLEKERKIVPISNLLFLKLDSSLSYNEITFDEIKIFDKLVREYSSSCRYISVKSVLDNIKCKVTESLFDECFVYGLLKYCGFLHQIPNLDKMFCAQSENCTRIQFLTYLIGSNKSVNAFDLIQAIKDTYGVDYSIYSIIYDIDKNKTKLYYNNETEKIYSNKEYFYEEIL